MIFIKIAWSNLFRNYRRTISTLLAILVGVGVIVFVNGFNDGISSSWSNGIINGRSGHFRLRHKQYNDFASTDMEKILIADPARLKEELKKNPHVTAAASRVLISGLAGQEEKSTTFIGAGYEMEELSTVLPLFGSGIVAGEGLEPGDPMGAVLGKALAESLNAKIGDELVILSNSIYGEQNAIVVYIKGLVTIPGAIQIEQSLILTSIDQVQTDLLDIDAGATEIMVRIDDVKNLEAVVNWVNDHFSKQGEPWVAIPWYDDQMFRQAMGFFRGIATLISIILSLVVGIVISNALLMSIFERIREIGTMRAVGTEKWQVYRIFYAEALITTFIGIMLGMLLGALVTWVTGEIGIEVPGLAQGMPIHPRVFLKNLVNSAILPVIVVCIAIIFPIRSSCKMDVVNALNYR
ncbi:MAG: ABC transporter permease [Deltaproteobacteria bacterium]|jgi:putative ABC transport system permease protein|nr:ABC transporter permease [Deltaproteobacteria bacterium]MBT4088020.1 ABC transporter permease [Deltaproteobacteria bacterium]MBT4263531.1 ABC transporter permease [Deltaproteobacteria bacterium]MBT4637833.1 ABC transporter permease [Deltaproteobacteria bacterium]MBT6500143.1 ABC transporter permease [Deltaproteobacteria bacterium]